MNNMLAILSNINMEPCKRYFEKEKIVFSSYGQYFEPFLIESSFIYQKDIKEVLVFLDGDQLLKDLIYKYPSKETFHFIDQELELFFAALNQFIARKPDVTLILNTLVLSPKTFCTYLISNDGVNFNEIEHYINNKIIQFSQKYVSILILNWYQTVKDFGFQNIFDSKFWYLGRIRLSGLGFSVLYQELINLRTAYYGRTKKVLIVDLDNTLWGGVLGEDGLNGIKLSEEGIEKVFRDFQKLVLSLKQIGIILCINSKNNQKDVNDLFNQHPMMILKYDDFIVKKINWNNKVDNIKEISRELNLSLDSMVFIDDSSVERQMVISYLPMVIVPEFPQETALLCEWFLRDVIYRYFPKYKINNEDIDKSKQYQRMIIRNELLNTLDIDSFIETLKIELEVLVNIPDNILRISNLTQKTNQFNLTNKRYTAAQIEQLMNDPDYKVFCLDYQDKFGHEGIVGVCITHKVGVNLEINVFLLSCRIIGRKVEYDFLYQVLSFFATEQVDNILIGYCPTAKNVIGKNFLDGLPLKVEKSVYHGKKEEILHFLERTLVRR